ncbi:MAG: carboxypeptidase regulatory-like domain-containing protein [Gemmatimonadaceae bacterium]|nr:carboxypeptidase regulatory-like domain-containing protein [Gemmatimonadaceae bacterium]
MRSAFFSIIAFAMVASTGVPRVALAQSESVRGRVTDDSGRVVVAAEVHITRSTDRLVQVTRTDSAGRYRVDFDPGSGDYLVFAVAEGFRGVRRRIQSIGARQLEANLVLPRDLTKLQAVRVVAPPPTRATDRPGAANDAPGSTDRWMVGVNGMVSPLGANDPLAMAGSLAGVTVTPNGLGALGADPSASLVTLNGLSLSANDLPRMALNPPNGPADIRVGLAPFDATRGGFSGASIDLRIGAGDRSYQHRAAQLTMAAAPANGGDALARFAAASAPTLRLSLGASGEMVRHALTYNTALDVTREQRSVPSLLHVPASVWPQVGASAEAAAQAVAAARAVGIQPNALSKPAAGRDAVVWMGRLDDTRDSLRSLSVMTLVNAAREYGAGASPLALPTVAATRSTRAVMVQLQHHDLVGAFHHRLWRNRLGISWNQDAMSGDARVPAARVLLSEAPTLGASPGTLLSLGGSALHPGTRSNAIAEGSSELLWNVGGSRHRMKALLWGRYERTGMTLIDQPVASYFFSSLDAYRRNTPSSFTATLRTTSPDGAAWNSAAAFSWQWVPSRSLSVQSGARIEAGGMATSIPDNAPLAASLGVRTGTPTARMHVSPRVGFTWTLSKRPADAAGFVVSSYGSLLRQPLGTIRGGIGEFRELVRAGPAQMAAARTGLAGGDQTLSCIGAASPLPDWSGFLTGSAAVPTQCADGSGFIDVASPAMVFDRTYQPSRAWRAALGWSGRLGPTTIQVDGLTSLGMHQAGTRDANFLAVPHFALADDGRPVFVPSSAIDPTSALLSPSAARRDASFGRVAVYTSDLRSRGAQLSLSVAPDAMRNRGARRYWSATYTWQRSQREQRGFDGTTAGDPGAKAWVAAFDDARHSLLLQGALRSRRLGSLTVFVRRQSGLPFTPVVDRDINGDGLSNDRAWVGTGVGVGDAASLALRAQLDTVTRALPSRVARCVASRAGSIAAPQSCRTGWSTAMQVNWLLRTRTIAGRPVTPTLVLQNPLAAVDLAMHGASRVRGWGSVDTPDPVLLNARSFDEGSRRFRYDVNPGFGAPRNRRSLSNNPFRMTIDVRVDFSVARSLQSLRRAIEPVRVNGADVAVPADTIAARRFTLAGSIYRVLLADADTLFLTQDQIRALTRADSLYWIAFRREADAHAQYLVQYASAMPPLAATDSIARSDDRLTRLMWEQVDSAARVLTPMQIAVAERLRAMLDVAREDRLTTFIVLPRRLPYVYRAPFVAMAQP